MIHNQTIFDKIGAKNSYWFGLATGVAGFFAIGFFVLLAGQFNGGFPGKASGRVAVANPSLEAPSPSLGAPTGSPNVQLSDDDWVRGDTKAPITIVEFSDIDCPFCQRHHNTMNELLTKYDGQINWVYRHFPLSSIHPDATKKAIASECAGSLGGAEAFWAYTDALFEQNEGGSTSELADIAQSIGVNRTKFETCVDNEEFADVVEADANAAVTAGGTGTPYNVIIAGDQQVPVNGAVPLERIEAMLEPFL